VQTTGLAPLQTPAWQLSVWVQRLPSLQALPSVFGGLLQTPVAGAQTPTSWHWSSAVQTTGLAPLQTPAWQLSVWVQASLSLQALPSAFGGLLQTPVAGAQTPTS
jgi:NCAIR mutase (PurE)-related protein